jgi:hypothetical protein
MFVFGWSLITLMQVGGLFIIFGFIAGPIAVVLSVAKRESAAKFLMKVAGGLIIVGLLSLGLVAVIGGRGVFNA